MWIVYCIQHTATKQLYFGVTYDLKQRIQRHNAKGKKFTTRKEGEWVLVYAEAYRAREDAIEREKRLKRHGSSKHELVKRIQKSLLNTKTGAG